MASVEVITEIDGLLATDGLEFHQTDNPLYREVVFGDIKDGSGQSVAFLREYLADGDLPLGLEALDRLGANGISVVNHMSVDLPSGLTVILADYVDGPRLDEVELPETTYLDLANKLSRYYVDRYLAGDPFLVDISDPFQYIAKGGEPVLIDIDMHVVPKCPKEHHLEMAREHILDIGQVYNPLLGYENGHLLASHLQMMLRELRYGVSASVVAV